VKDLGTNELKRRQHMTSTATTKTTTPSATFYGNVGNDPETIHFEARTDDITVYDPMIDDMVEKTITIPASTALRFSVAVNYKDGEEERTRWINVFDPEELASKNLIRKGDRVKITGYFRTRQGVDKKTGETKEYRNLVLQGLHVEKRKIREAA
jgi:single-stranded DNA-binding protein